MSATAVMDSQQATIVLVAVQIRQFQRARELVFASPAIQEIHIMVVLQQVLALLMVVVTISVKLIINAFHKAAAVLVVLLDSISAARQIHVCTGAVLSQNVKPVLFTVRL